MMEISKKEFRKMIADKRAGLSKEYMKNASDGITKAVLESDIYKKSRCIFIFVSMPGEPDTTGIIKAAFKDGKTVCVPKCYENRQMKPVIIKSLDDLKPGAYGIPEPYGELEIADEADVDLSFIPCISANKKGERIGHGGGYYDIFLERSKSIRLCICFEKLSAPDIPVSDLDQKMDYVLTESGVFRCNGLSLIH